MASDAVATPRAEDNLAERLDSAAKKLFDATSRNARLPWLTTWFVSEPDLRKYLDRLSDAVSDLSRLLGAGELDAVAKKRAGDLLAQLDHCLRKPRCSSLLALLHEFQLVLIDHGDAQVVCGMVEGELRWHKQDTSWLTWDGLYGNSRSEAVDEYRNGNVSYDALAAARNQLRSLYRARRDERQALLCRAEARTQNLRILTVVLVVLLPFFLLAYYYAVHPHPRIPAIIMLPLAGAVGAALSGTLKARDRLVREADIHRFRDGLYAQLLVGASAAVIVVVLLRAKLTSIGEIKVDTVIAQAAFGFLAGLSEPFVLGTVQRAARLGSSEETPATRDTTG